MYPAEEYQKIPLILGYIVNTMRLSIGDFTFDGVQYMSLNEQIMFFVIWAMCLFLANIIFLNFIIAEVSNIYSMVTAELSAMQNYGKAQMITEVELIIPKRVKTKEMFPKYIIIREIEN